MTFTPIFIGLCIGFLLYKQQGELIGGLDHNDVGSPGGGFALMFVLFGWVTVITLIISGFLGFDMFGH